MIKYLFFVLSVFAIACSNAPSNLDISGNWEWQSDDPTADFSITLEQSGEKITGYYCGIFNNGDRIDCPFEDEQNISGELDGNIWHNDYTSNYSMQKGKAELTFDKKRNELIWINKTTSNGAFCPDSAVLVKNQPQL